MTQSPAKKSFFNRNVDLMNGPIFKSLLVFMLPILVSCLFQQLYNTVDTMIVGNVLGDTALAAIGACGAIYELLVGFGIGIGNGLAIVAARAYGAGDDDQLKQTVAGSIVIGIIASAVITLAGAAGLHPLLELLDTPAEILEDAYGYIIIIDLGVIVMFAYNLCAGLLRAIGNSFMPLVFLILSSVLNVILDLWFIAALGMGVAGAGVATVISQGISAVLCLIYMIRHYPILHMKNGEWKPDGRMLGTLCSMGIPMGLQYSITAIGSVVLQTAVNSLGSMAVAAVSTGSKVSMFFCCPFDALGGTMATYAGQNVGAKKLDRVKEGLKAASLIGIIYSVIAFVILFFGGKYIALLFMDADQTEIIGRVAMFLIGNSMFYIPLTFVNVVRFTIQGMGFSTFAILAGVCEMAARSLVGFCLVPVFGFLPACFASPLAWIFADAFLIPAFFHCMKKLKVLFGETA